MKHLVFTLLLAAAAPAFAQDPCAQKNSAACVKATQERCRQAVESALEKQRSLPYKDAAGKEARNTQAMKIENLINENRSKRVDECTISGRVTAQVPK